MALKRPKPADWTAYETAQIGPRAPRSIVPIWRVDIFNEDHDLVRLSKMIDRESLEAEVADQFFSAVAPALSSRLVLELDYLQNLLELINEAVLYRFVESPYYQYFSGCEFSEHTGRFHPACVTKWRKLAGEAGWEELLATTINAAVKPKVIQPSSLKRVVVDSTGQEKNITYSADSKLYEKGCRQLVLIARRRGIVLRQTYDKLCRNIVLTIGRCVHARQSKRMRRDLKKLKGCTDRVYRDLNRQVEAKRIDLSEKE